MADRTLWRKLLLLVIFCTALQSKLISMTEDNYIQILDRNDVVLVMFHRNWTKAVQRLKQGFDDASKSIETRLRMANLDATFAFAYANCEENSTFDYRFELKRFPTFMLIADGAEREYRGSKTVNALTIFVLNAVESFVAERELRREQEEERQWDAMQIEGSGEEPATHVKILTSANFQDVRANSDVLVVLFYVEWCPHSRRYKPIFAQAAKTFARSRNRYDASVKVVFGSLNCDENKDICGRFWVENFPTVDVFRNGELKGGFKLSTDVKVLREDVQRNVDLTIRSYKTEKELKRQIDPTKHHVIAEFASNRSLEYQQFIVFAKSLTNKCVIHDGPGTGGNETASIEFLRQYSSKRVPLPDRYYDSFPHLKYWLTERCSLEQVYDSFLLPNDEVFDDTEKKETKTENDPEEQPETEQDEVEKLLLLS